MIRLGKRVSAPRGLNRDTPVTGVVIRQDPTDPPFVYYVYNEEEEREDWTHKDETVLVPDPSDERISTLEFQLANMTRSYEDSNEANRAQAERIAPLIFELINTHAQMERHKALAEHWETQYNQRGKVYDDALAGMARLSTTIAALKALVRDVSDAAAAKEQIWLATEHYNVKAERAREALAAFQKLDDSFPSERGE